MTEIPHVRIRNWERFQHYGNRTNVPWIKLYVQLLDDMDFARLPDVTKAHVFALFLLAGRYHNHLPADLPFLASKLNATDTVNWTAILKARWIEPCGLSASDLLATTESHASAHASVEVETTKTQDNDKDKDVATTSPASTALVSRKDNTLAAVQEHLRDVGLEAIAKARQKEARRLGAEFVFAYWCQKLRHESALLDSHRERAVVQALKANRESVSELLYVVDGAARDEWACAEIGRHDPKVLFRDRTSIEKYAGKCEGYRKGTEHPTWTRTKETP